ncbi:MAG TPA: efflux RND transporter periplasmic adaptor subunit [Gemmatimonadaceae bacterium]|nr:efflux RND transporter periplasmic adaptor subunit [Gemmatimonadaceae bacterium]
MKNKTLVLAAVVVLVGVVWWLNARHDEPAPDAVAAHEGMPGMESPSAQESTPGMDNMPGMDMSGRDLGDGTVALSAGQLREFGVTFGTVAVRTLESTTRATGIVTVDETRVARVAPKASGYVERVYADYTGQTVRRGEPLVELYSPDVLAAQEELLLAARLARTLSDSGVPGVPESRVDVLGTARRRLQLLDVTEAQIDEVLRTGQASRTITIHAPAGGTITEKSVVLGEAVDAGATLYTIADLSRVWVEAEVREADAAMLKRGLKAEIALAGQPGRALAGQVEFVYPTVDPATRSVRARIGVANADGALRPGAYAIVSLTAPSRRALTVPASAVIHTGERSLVFVDMGNGRLMSHDVETGRREGDLVEVLTGVEAGQRVVTSAQYLLESESNLADVMRAMMVHQ